MSISISPGRECFPELLSTAIECEGTSLVSAISGDVGLGPSENAVVTKLLRLGSRQAGLISDALFFWHVHIPQRCEVRKAFLANLSWFGASSWSQVERRGNLFMRIRFSASRSYLRLFQSKKMIQTLPKN